MHFVLTPDEAVFLASLPSETQLVQARRKLVQEGRGCEHLFVVRRGWLAAFRQLPDGGRQIFNFWLPGEFAGIELLSYDAAPFSVMSLTSCCVSRVSRESVEQMKDAFPRLAIALLTLACRNNLILRERVVSLGRRSAFVRVAHLLLELSLRVRGAAEGVTSAPMPLTQLEIADSTGLTAPYVNRILRTMRERGFLRFSKEGFEVENVRKLMALVDFRPDYLRSTPALGSAERTSPIVHDAIERVAAAAAILP